MFRNLNIRCLEILNIRFLKKYDEEMIDDL
jgi:hypothetical protein